MDKKLDITSTAVEKTIDAVTSFLSTLLGPAVEETGLLIKSPITMYKFKRDIKMLAQAKAICKEHNISTKHIPLKLIAPMLEYSGLEEDDEMLYKWSNLLVNLVYSEQNITNHVFPYILSQ